MGSAHGIDFKQCPPPFPTSWTSDPKAVMFVSSQKSNSDYVQHRVQVPPEYYSPAWFTWLAGSDLDQWRSISRVIADKQQRRLTYHTFLQALGIARDLCVLVDLYLFRWRDFRFIIERDGACSYACADTWCGYRQKFDCCSRPRL
jgi:hypothetical protein